MSLLFRNFLSMTLSEQQLFVEERRSQRQYHYKDVKRVKNKNKKLTTKELAQSLGIPEAKLISFLLKEKEKKTNVVS